jgi:hypothetical protein
MTSSGAGPTALMAARQSEPIGKGRKAHGLGAA